MKKKETTTHRMIIITKTKQDIMKNTCLPQLKRKRISSVEAVATTALDRKDASGQTIG